uniref:Uncharacterized protein n=1 Tax=Timema douglasi TaxID=61478 RepID=A0A7R8VTF0_TIMDO|nr:unnamed protein product [Timema douglasi]
MRTSYHNTSLLSRSTNSKRRRVCPRVGWRADPTNQRSGVPPLTPLNCLLVRSQIVQFSVPVNNPHIGSRDIVLVYQTLHMAKEALLSSKPICRLCMAGDSILLSIFGNNEVSRRGFVTLATRIMKCAEVKFGEPKQVFICKPTESKGCVSGQLEAFRSCRSRGPQENKHPTKGPPYRL